MASLPSASSAAAGTQAIVEHHRAALIPIDAYVTNLRHASYFIADPEQIMKARARATEPAAR